MKVIIFAPERNRPLLKRALPVIEWALMDAFEAKTYGLGVKLRYPDRDMEPPSDFQMYVSGAPEHVDEPTLLARRVVAMTCWHLAVVSQRARALREEHDGWTMPDCIDLAG